MNINEPEIIIKTNGITKTEVIVDGKKLSGVTGVCFFQSYKENGGLPILQIDLKATNVTLDTKMLPALPEPFSNHYLPINALLNSGAISNSDLVELCREHGINLERI